MASGMSWWKENLILVLLNIVQFHSVVLIFRYVLDGWPLTRAHVDLLTKFHILPVCVVELEISDQEMLRRGDLDRKGPNRSAVCACVWGEEGGGMFDCVNMYLYACMCISVHTCSWNGCVSNSSFWSQEHKLPNHYVCNLKCEMIGLCLVTECKGSTLNNNFCCSALTWKAWPTVL